MYCFQYNAYKNPPEPIIFSTKAPSLAESIRAGGWCCLKCVDVSAQDTLGRNREADYVFSDTCTPATFLWRMAINRIVY